MLTAILIFAAFAALVFIAVRFSGDKTNNTRQSPERRNLTVSDEKFNDFFKDGRRPEYRQGKEFKISGLNHRKNLITFGDFEGYIKPEINNPYDPYAIGVYSKNNEEAIGYLPKSDFNKKMFEAMLRQDILIYASGYVSEFTNDSGEKKLYGRVYIDIQE